MSICPNNTLFGPIEFPIKFDTIKSGWSIVYIEGKRVIISKKIYYLPICFVLANSADPDETPPHVTSHMGLHCAPCIISTGSSLFAGVSGSGSIQLYGNDKNPKIACNSVKK